MARNPPAQNTPQIFYGTMDTLLAAGAQGAFSNRPSSVFGVERDAKTPQSFNYSAGIQRELGWGTVIDVTAPRGNPGSTHPYKKVNCLVGIDPGRTEGHL